ncbi:MAG TPA: biosynthetic-type acetolactate synthase large subunit [Spirochaetota bacterium]|nr:biosynthetic-type acetolactate synthase large subunit [Spirochaetota bacterium]
MKLTGAEIIVRCLERLGITTITGIPGGSNLPMYDALYHSTIRHVLARHEQGAGFIAQGIARSTGKPAVCLATSGPGATNLITAIADARLDSVPLIAITGQVPLPMIGTDAFQEVDMHGLTIPITKHTFLVRNAGDIAETICEAFYIAASGRPGPVVIDVPKDIQNEAVDIETWPEVKPLSRSAEPSEADIRRIAEMIHSAERPLLYIGGGIISSHAAPLIEALSAKNSIPVTSTLMGLGAYPPESPLYLGMLGMHGELSTNMIIDEADLLLAFGVRFDDRATGRVEEFSRHASIIHVDIDHSEIDKIKQSNVSLIADIGEVLKKLLPRVKESSREEWRARIHTLQRQYPPEDTDAYNPLHPLRFIRTLGNNAPSGTIVTTDVGQHQMWTAQSYTFRKPGTFLTSGGLGTMGFGLPAAIGAALANPEDTVICISGDGSILMNIQELATLADYGLNVKLFIMNNNHLGLVRQQQELFYGGHLYASKFITSPDFAALGRGFGIRSLALDQGRCTAEMLREILHSPGPCLIEVPVDADLNVMPMVPPGKSNREMIGGRTNG